jgi:hypothetical protein
MVMIDFRGQSLGNQIVARKAFKSGLGQAFGPIRFAGPGHTDERNAHKTLFFNPEDVF